MLTALKFIMFWTFVSYVQRTEVEHAHKAQMEAEVEMMRIEEEMRDEKAQEDE